MRDFLVGTAGHIDHGKTSLLRALTGIDTDRLAEEKRRGITIDLGFAHLEEDDFRIGFIDVPGHERFVKNMLAGIGGIRLVLLVVAADESVMPQTREHFQICRLLGIQEGIVVLTKKDLVDEELLQLVKEEVAELVAGSFLESAPLVAVDSLTQEGIPRLRQVLLEQVRNTTPENGEAARQVFRLPIDRVFTLRGFGTVVTGTPISGELAGEAQIQVYPSLRKAKVRSIHVFDQPVATARFGQRTALNLTGIEKDELERGMTLSTPGSLRPSYMFDAHLTLLNTAPAPLPNRAPIRFHHGSAEITGRIQLLEQNQLPPGEASLVQLRLDRPAVCCPGDRFVIRRYSPLQTLGGGVILDNHPRKHRKALKQLVPSLRKLHELVTGRPGEARNRGLIAYYVEQMGPAGIPLTGLTARTGLRADRLQGLLSDTRGVLRINAEPALAVWEPALEELERKMIGFLEEFHAANPLAQGLSQQELKSRFLGWAPQALFLLVLERLQQQQQVEVTAGTVRRFGRKVELSSEQEELKEKMLACFPRKELSWPGLTRLTKRLGHPPDQTRDLFHHLLDEGVLVRVAGELVLSSQQVEYLEQRVRRRFDPGDTFGVGEFKELFDISRKYAIPLLEYLDRVKITRRIGDKRVLL